MTALGWLAKSAGDRYVLAYDPERLRVADVYRQSVLEGGRSTTTGRNRALDELLARFAAHADGALDVSLRKLLESDVA